MDRKTLHQLYYDTRDDQVRDQLISEYEGLARRLASRFSKRVDDMDDLVQVALVGLLKALERFDPKRGVQFTTFAWATVEGELKRHLRDRSWGVRVPRRLQESYLRTSAAVEELTHALGRSPTVAELAEHTGDDEDTLVQALEVRAAASLTSLDAPVRDESGWIDRLGSVDGGFEDFDDLTALGDLLARLPDRERTIVRLRFGEEMKQSEIGAVLGLSQMQISRILARVMDQLRSWSADHTTLTN
ncbi:MAG: SigB/SigF/SigG family RNA polymerase sigma factor [Acidimicrobiales bacterium]